MTAVALSLERFQERLVPPREFCQFGNIVVATGSTMILHVALQTIPADSAKNKRYDLKLLSACRVLTLVAGLVPPGRSFPDLVMYHFGTSALVKQWMLHN